MKIIFLVMGKTSDHDMEKDEVLSNFFASVFTGNHSSHISQVPDPSGRDWGNKVPFVVGED